MSPHIQGAIFDLDGTVYLGDAALPGAAEGIATLRELGVKVLFVSNKPLEPRDSYAKKLTRLGIPATPDDVLTSATVLGYHLAQHEPELRLYVVGEERLREELRGYGLNVLDDFTDQDEKDVIAPHGIDAVVVAFDRTLDYRKVNIAYQALMAGARFFATNADKTCPMPGGAIPDAGAIIAALQHMTGREVELLAGKPSSLIINVALSKLGVPASNAIMVGDRLETDMFMGQQAGMFTAATLTGVATREAIAAMATPPDYVISSLMDLIPIVQGD